MNETETFLKNTSLNSLLCAIKNESNPLVRECLKCMKAEKMIFINPHMNEVLRVIKDDKLNFVGFKSYHKGLHKILEKDSETMTRGYAEYNSEYRQLVANVLIHGKTNSGSDVFGFLKRFNGYTEKSLVGSAGMVGGHINVSDRNLFQGLIRELSEEIKNVPFDNSKIFPFGFIREMGDNISRQHLCVLYVMELTSDANMNLISGEVNEKFVWYDTKQVEKELSGPIDSCVFDTWARKALENYLKFMNTSEYSKMRNSLES